MSRHLVSVLKRQSNLSSNITRFVYRCWKVVNNELLDSVVAEQTSAFPVVSGAVDSSITWKVKQMSKKIKKELTEKDQD